MKKSKATRTEHPRKAARSRRSQWWEPVEESLSGLDLRGLRVRCPQCGTIGLATTRWIRGPSVKPIYVLHTKGNDVHKACEVHEDQSSEIRRKVSMREKDIRTLLERREPFVLFSGGKDSLAALLYLRNISEGLERDLTVIYVDTTVGLAETTEYVKEVCTHLGVNLEIVRPIVDFFTLAKKWGIPSFRYRWCCRELKIKPIAEYLGNIEEPKVVFDGIRAVESNIRKRYLPIWYHPTFKCLSVSPIFRWTDEQVVSLNNNNGIPTSLLHSLLGSSTECWCGAYKTETDFRRLYELDPDLYRKLVKIEDETGERYTFLFKKGKKIPLSELENQILEENAKSVGN